MIFGPFKRLGKFTEIKEYGFKGNLGGLDFFLLFEAFETTLICFQSAMQFGMAFWESVVAFFWNWYFCAPFKTHLETYLGYKKTLEFKEQDYSR